MKKLVPVFLAVFLLTSGLAAGAEIDFYKREALIEKSSAKITDTILFQDMPQDLQIPLPFSISDFSTSATFRNLNCGVQEKEYGSLVRCDLPKAKEGRLSLEFETDDLVGRINSHYYYEDTLKVPASTEKLVYTLKLRSGLILIPPNSSSPFSQYSPNFGKKGSDGRRIFVYWTKKNVSKGGGITTSVSFETAQEGEEELTNIYTFIAGIIILAILLVLAFTSAPEKERDLALKEDEGRVVDIIKNLGGEVKQKRIVNQTEFSKAKVSRLIKDLEERNLLEKEKVGRTNRIKLKERSG